MQATLSPLELLIISLFLLGIMVLVAFLAMRAVHARRGETPVTSFKKTEERAADSTSPRVFICYRREDTADVVGRVYDRLVEKFGVANVFKDVDSAPLGRDFRESADKSISSCHAFLAFIGRDWLAESSDGSRRIDDPTDFVRIEIAAALARNIPVVPVLVRGGVMPTENSLPSEIASLAFRNGVPVRSDPDFRTDVDRLIYGLEAAIAES